MGPRGYGNGRRTALWRTVNPFLGRSRETAVRRARLPQVAAGYPPTRAADTRRQEKTWDKRGDFNPGGSPRRHESHRDEKETTDVVARQPTSHQQVTPLGWTRASPSRSVDKGNKGGRAPSRLRRRRRWPVTGGQRGALPNGEGACPSCTGSTAGEGPFGHVNS